MDKQTCESPYRNYNAPQYCDFSKIGSEVDLQDSPHSARYFDVDHESMVSDGDEKRPSENLRSREDAQSDGLEITQDNVPNVSAEPNSPPGVTSPQIGDDSRPSVECQSNRIRSTFSRISDLPLSSAHNLEMKPPVRSKSTPDCATPTCQPRSIIQELRSRADTPRRQMLRQKIEETTREVMSSPVIELPIPLRLRSPSKMARSSSSSGSAEMSPSKFDSPHAARWKQIVEATTPDLISKARILSQSVSKADSVTIDAISSEWKQQKVSPYVDMPIKQSCRSIVRSSKKKAANAHLTIPVSVIPAKNTSQRLESCKKRAAVPRFQKNTEAYLGKKRRRRSMSVDGLDQKATVAPPPEKSRPKVAPFSFVDRDIQNFNNKRLSRANSKTDVSIHYAPGRKCDGKNFLCPDTSVSSFSSKRRCRDRRSRSSDTSYGPGSLQAMQKTIPRPFSFAKRDAEWHNRHDSLVQQVMEEERRLREFKAQPVPDLVKDVGHPSSHSTTVKHVTKAHPFDFQIDRRVNARIEKWKSDVEHELAEQIRMASSFKAMSPAVLRKDPFIPQPSSQPLTEVSNFELHSSVRAEQRSEYDRYRLEHVARRDAQIEQAEEDRRHQMEAEIKQLRKDTVHRANPIRHYRAIEVQKSDKPNTVPVSPAFTRRPARERH